jgi:CheY-like chemotaxis protein
VVSDLVVLVMPQAVSVLIVDDSIVFRGVARELLERRGYVVAGEADCAGSAIALLIDIEPDAARMPADRVAASSATAVEACLAAPSAWC